VTEFVYSGFSSLMALDPVMAKPFDRERKGLSVGEAAAYAVIMSEERVKREKREILGIIAGWGLSDDANHMTGPSRTSEGLTLAVRKALASAGMDARDIGCISAHGTGTVYNDAMEMRAFHEVFDGSAVPVYSVKGGIGHTMGAAGLVEVITALKVLRERAAPPTVNLRVPDHDAEGWVSSSARSLGEKRTALITNAGFSGINTAVVVTAGS
jgi:3-oxoacyl-[acyl-carrier-protein] synthase II